LNDMQLYAVAGLPHVGRTQAAKLLSNFLTVRRVFTASKDELMEIDRIGKQVAEDITKVLDTPFNLENEGVNEKGS